LIKKHNKSQANPPSPKPLILITPHTHIWFCLWTTLCHHHITQHRFT